VTEEKEEKSEVYRFNECELDADRREITMAGEPVTTQPKAFELLLYLVRNRSRAVDKDELQDALWPRSIVTETALTRCVMKARRAVGDDAGKGRLDIGERRAAGARADVEAARAGCGPRPLGQVLPEPPETQRAHRQVVEPGRPR